MLCVCTFSFGLSRKKKITKRKGPGYVSGATPALPFADGARTRFAQTDRPLPAPDNAYAYAPTPMPESCAVGALRYRRGGLYECVFSNISY